MAKNCIFFIDPSNDAIIKHVILKLIEEFSKYSLAVYADYTYSNLMQEFIQQQVQDNSPPDLQDFIAYCEAQVRGWEQISHKNRARIIQQWENEAYFYTKLQSKNVEYSYTLNNPPTCEEIKDYINNNMDSNKIRFIMVNTSHASQVREFTQDKVECLRIDAPVSVDAAVMASPLTQQIAQQFVALLFSEAKAYIEEQISYEENDENNSQPIDDAHKQKQKQKKHAYKKRKSHQARIDKMDLSILDQQIIPELQGLQIDKDEFRGMLYKMPEPPLNPEEYGKLDEKEQEQYDNLKDGYCHLSYETIPESKENGHSTDRIVLIKQQKNDDATWSTVPGTEYIFSITGAVEHFEEDPFHPFTRNNIFDENETYRHRYYPFHIDEKQYCHSEAFNQLTREFRQQVQARPQELSQQQIEDEEKYSNKL